MSEPVNDDLLPGHVGIDASLAAARRKHAERLAAALDLDAGLAAILTSGENTDHAGLVGATDPGAPASSRPEPPLPGGQAAVILVIRGRARARGLARALGSIRARTDALARDLARTRARDLRRVYDFARDLADALGLARTLARTLARDLAGDLADARARALARALARDLADARDLARDLADARARALARARDLARQIQGALYRADELVGRLHVAEVDASGADLSALDLADISVLEGVVWTGETTWPNGMREQVQLRSREIRPGVYQVGGGSERYPSQLVIT